MKKRNVPFELTDKDIEKLRQLKKELNLTKEADQIMCTSRDISKMPIKNVKNKIIIREYEGGREVILI